MVDQEEADRRAFMKLFDERLAAQTSRVNGEEVTHLELKERLVRAFRLRAARELCGLRSTQALADHLDAKGFSYAKLSKIEQAAATLSPQDADYIAKRLGLHPTFFTSPLYRLGDTQPDSE